MENHREINGRFTNGNRFAKGGKREGAGRPTNLEQELKGLAQEAKRLAVESDKKYLEDHLRPILDTYISLATGKPCGKARCKLDPATTRHAVERFIGPAPRSLILDLQDSVETFFDEVEAMARGQTKGNRRR